MTCSRRLGPLLLGAAVLLGACGGDDDASGVTVPEDEVTTSTSTTTGSTTTTTDPDADVKEAIEQAYYDQWDAYIEILSDPDPTNPLIEQHFTGAARERLLDSIAEDVRAGIVTRRPDNPDNFRADIIDVSLAEEQATVISCLVDGLVQVDRTTGAVVNDAVATLKIETSMVLEDQNWKLEDSVRLSRLEGATSCE